MRRDSGTAEEAAAEAAEAAAEAAAGMQGDERRGARDAARGAVPVAVKDERDGRYTCSCTAYRAGAYTLSVALRGETLPGSPFRAHVAPATVHAGACVATGDGMQKATAGVPARFALALRDPYGNVLDCASQRPASWACALRGPNGVALHATLSDRGDGRIAGEYTALVAGDYTLSLTLGTLHVKASPAAVRVGPGAPHAPSCSSSRCGWRCAASRATSRSPRATRGATRAKAAATPSRRASARRSPTGGSRGSSSAIWPTARWRRRSRRWPKART